MKQWLIVLIGAFLGFGMVIESAEAKRLGGGRNLGSQRQIAPQQPATTPSKQTQQNQATPTQTPATAPAARTGMGRWLAPLAGLAIGLGLASLFGEEMGSFIVLALIILAAIVVLRMLFGSKTQRRTLQTPQGIQYSGLGHETDAAPPPSQNVSGIGRPDLRAQFSPSIPDGFDVDGFLAQAKRNFLALQAANDHADTEALREMMSDELYENLKQDIEGRQGAAQQTDVVTLDAQLLEVVTESGMHWASIRFSGMLREETSGVATRFEEIWNLQKPESGRTGWMLAGIQQVA